MPIQFKRYHPQALELFSQDTSTYKVHWLLKYTEKAAHNTQNNWETAITNASRDTYQFKNRYHFSLQAK